MISFTSEECRVTTLLEYYYQQINILICTDTTSYKMESGYVIIFKFGQGLWYENRIEKTLINPNKSNILVYQSAMTLSIVIYHWELRHILTPISQRQLWDPHVDLLLGILHMTRLRHVDTLLFLMNTIVIHQNIFSKNIQWRSSKGATYLTPDQSIKWGFKHPMLHLSHIPRMEWSPMILIELWWMYQSDYLRILWWTG